MPLTLTLPFACAALMCTQAATPSEDKVEQSEAAPAASSVPEAPEGPSSVKLIAFDGARDFMKTSRRFRVWREEVYFDMMVDEQGAATDCSVVNRFRKTIVNKKLCAVVMAHHTFEPARNAQNEAVPGSYRAKISFADLRAELD